MSQVNVEVVAATDDAVRKIGQFSSSMDSMGKAAARDAAGALGVFGVSVTKLNQPLTLAAEFLKDATTQTIKYASTVRDMSRNLGISAEETSRLIQVSDDYKISSDQLQSSLQMAVKKGFEPSIESIARLADEYNALESPSEKAAMLAEKFGKGWATLTPLLEAGGDAIRSQAAAIDQSLILTQSQITKARELEKAWDDLNDSGQALKLTVGNALIPPLTAVTKDLNSNVDSWQLYSQAVKSGALSTEDSLKALMMILPFIRDDAKAQEFLTQKLNENKPAITGWAAAWYSAKPAIQGAADATQAAIDPVKQLANEQMLLAAGLTGAYSNAFTTHAEQLSKINAAYDTNKNGIISTKEATGEYSAAVDASSAALDRNIKQLIAQQAAASLDAGGQLELYRSMGLIDEKSYKAAEGILGLTQKLENGTLTQDEFIAATNRAASDMAKYGVVLETEISPKAQVASDAIRYMNQNVNETPDKTVVYDTSSIPGPALAAAGAITAVNDAMAKSQDKIVNYTVNYAITGAAEAQGVLGYLNQPGHATGGRESSGMPRLVGEQGPEMFVPDSGGYTVNNSDTQKMIQLLSGIFGAVKGGMRSTTYNVGGSVGNRGSVGGGGNARALAGAF